MFFYFSFFFGKEKKDRNVDVTQPHSCTEIPQNPGDFIHAWPQYVGCYTCYGSYASEHREVPGPVCIRRPGAG